MIVIPSFERYDNLKKHTLSFLKRYDIPDSEIVVVVSEHDKQLSQYLTLDCGVIVTEANKIGDVHNFITDTFDEGEFICELDDDIRHIKNKDLINIESFTDLLSTAKNLLVENKASYCGTYSVPNKMFMNKSNEISLDLKYCLGLIRFRFIRKEIKCKTSYSEDYENCIRHYVRDGKIIRLNHICGITANYAAGGCDGSGRNLETERTHKEELCKLFPNHTTLFQRKNKRYDIRLKDKSPISSLA